MTQPQILILDDNATQAATRSAILSRAGLSVVVAREGAEALRMLADPEVSAGIRLLISDHVMPGMNGPEVVRRARALLPDLPVLVISGMPGVEADYAGFGVYFRMKPFPPAEFIVLTRNLIEGPAASHAGTEMACRQL
ncbi:MAG TPA: response regulator [Acidobacteriaceae bacterium]